MIFFAVYFLVGIFLPVALPGCLLFGTAVDWMIPFERLNIYSNEWALLGAVFGLGVRQWMCRDLPEIPRNVILAFSPVAVMLVIHVFWPGPADATGKDILRAGEFFLGLFLPTWLLSGKALTKTLIAAGFFVTLASVYAMIQHFAGPGAVVNAGHEEEVFGGSFQAASSFFQHHNQFGAFACSAIPLFAAASYPVVVVLALGGLLVSYSRGALVGLILGIASVVWALSRITRVILGSSVLLGLLAALAVPATRDRLDSIVSLQRNNDRIMIWGVGKEMLEKAPIWGNGAGFVNKNLPASIDALPVDAMRKIMFKAHLHNQWLQWAVEYGVLGAMAWMIFFASIFLGACQSIRWGEPRTRLFGIALAVAVVAFCVQQSTDLLMLHARGLDISLLWGLGMAGMKDKAEKF